MSSILADFDNVMEYLGDALVAELVDVQHSQPRLLQSLPQGRHRPNIHRGMFLLFLLLPGPGLLGSGLAGVLEHENTGELFVLLEKIREELAVLARIVHVLIPQD